MYTRTDAEGRYNFCRLPLGPGYVLAGCPAAPTPFPEFRFTRARSRSMGTLFSTSTSPHRSVVARRGLHSRWGIASACPGIGHAMPAWRARLTLPAAVSARPRCGHQERLQNVVRTFRSAAHWQA